MSLVDHSQPILVSLYLRYLDDPSPARFIQSISRRYTIGTLERMTESDEAQSRRAAVMALGFVGNFTSNAVLGPRLQDTDRAVRALAEHSIREVWTRFGDESDQLRLRGVIRSINAARFDEAVQRGGELIDDVPRYAEAWNQRAIAFYQLERFEQSIFDCRRALELNPFHFAAAIGMAHGFLELGDGDEALSSLQRALEINPDLEGVRNQVRYLQRALDEK